ncbi:major capsid protein [Pseudomonas sp. P8_250]|jgi:hypothetical protein|uniref:major capsid protein n=1 Tax=Pseudomonas sp. P8_250 TaxID=3043446 RepID=UPI002A359C4A|nr:major capsid protein [Pseudomonas sp. P8_250]MDX9668772.1 major capsid protein [Pseudomonas sp. P8_250]
MGITLNRNNLGKVVDRTDVLVDVPYTADITEALGIFTDYYSTQKTVEIVRKTSNQQILGDSNWDGRGQTLTVEPTREFVQAKIPHFAAEDAIYPHDIDGVVQIDDSVEIMNLAQVADIRAEKMLTLKDSHNLTQVAARFQLLRDGTVYAPNKTLRTSYGDTINFYTEFGVTRESIAMDFGNTTDPRAQSRVVLAKMRKDLRGTSGALRGVVALCGSEFFTKVIMNPYVTEMLKSLPTSQSLATLLGVNADDPRFSGLNERFPSISLFGITYVDVGVSGYDVGNSFVPFVADDQAILLPVGLTNLAKTYYAPANRFSSVNKKSQGSYWFEKATDEKVEIKTEQNFMNALLWPAAVKTLTLA